MTDNDRKQIKLQALKESSMPNAVLSENIGTIQLLLRNGFGVNDVDDDENAALHFAACLRNKDIAEFLLRQGASTDLVNDLGMTALHLAVEKRNKEVIKILLNNKANVDIANNEGDTALHTAAHQENKEVIELLLKNGADINAVDNQGDTALHIATFNLKQDIVKALLDRNDIDTNKVNKEGLSPLDVATRQSGKIAKNILQLFTTHKGAIEERQLRQTSFISIDNTEQLKGSGCTRGSD